MIFLNVILLLLRLLNLVNPYYEALSYIAHNKLNINLLLLIFTEYGDRVTIQSTKLLKYYIYSQNFEGSNFQIFQGYLIVLLQKIYP